MPQTVTAFAVTTAAYVWYTVRTWSCRKIKVSEVAQAGTTDFYVSTTAADADRRQIAAGKEYVFEPGYVMNPGDRPFAIKTVSANVNFDAEEQ